MPQAPGPLITLLELREVQLVLAGLSYMQIMQLARNLIPPGTMQAQIESMTRVQELFTNWAQDGIEKCNKELAQQPEYFHRNIVNKLQPNIPPDVVYFTLRN